MAGAYITSSAVHTSITTGTLGATVSTGDLIIVMARGESGHSTATDTAGVNAYTEWGYIADGNSGFITITCLARVATSTYIPAIALAGAGKYFDAYAFSGLTNPASVTPTFTTYNSDPGGGTVNVPTSPAVATPTGTVTLAIGWACTVDNWSNWYQGGGANAVPGSITSTPGHSAAQTNASAYQVGITAGTFNPGIVSNQSSNRTCILAVFFQESGGGGGSRPVKMAGEWGGYAGESGGFAGKSRHGLHIPSRYGDQRIAA